MLTCFGQDGAARIRRFMNDIISRLREFMENEARSCSMDYGCVTPQYVFRMWGGVVALNEIEAAMIELKRQSLSV